MEDIAPKLLEQIKNDFEKRFAKSKKLKGLYKRISDGTANYEEAHEFAIEVGEILKSVFGENISSSVLPDGRMYYNIADRVIRPMLENNYNIAAEVSAEVQTALNKSAGIGIKAVKPKMNEDKVQGIVDIVSGKENYDDIAYMLGEPVVNFTQSVVDDTVRENANFQYNAGMRPRIIRTSTGKCCDWCSNLEGTYEYPNVPKDIYRRHKNCKCMVVYNPADGKRKVQNIHSKQWQSEKEYDKIIKQKKAKELELANGLAAQIVAHPKRLQAYTPASLKKALEDAGYTVTPLKRGGLKNIEFEDGGGYKVNFGGDGILQYHPEGSHHGGEYYKTSKGEQGTKRYDMKGNEIDAEADRRTGKQIEK